MRNAKGGRQDQLLNLLVIWTITFFPALMVETRGLADRYYIIPQFLLFCSIALAIGDGLHRWRLPLHALLTCGFVYAQATSFRETLRYDNRPPFETFAYGSYSDTSRHFLRLDRLSDYLERQGLCRVESSNFFIAQPTQFWMATHARCENPETVAIEYCTDCGGPVAWFELTPARAGCRELLKGLVKKVWATSSFPGCAAARHLRFCPLIAEKKYTATKVTATKTKLRAMVFPRVGSPGTTLLRGYFSHVTEPPPSPKHRGKPRLSPLNTTTPLAGITIGADAANRSAPALRDDPAVVARDLRIDPMVVGVAVETLLPEAGQRKLIS